ncbi:MAG TPA: hypothetical protein VKK31_23225 [Thermoanaerobaculia bacterium]|nr:hypothetical protein [Thermoanaerobaculia bacterium]
MPLPAPLLIDAHVHFHACFNRDAFLDAAVDNFARGAAELGIGGPVTGCLMFSESHADRWLLRWGRGEDGVRFGAWDFEPTPEGEGSLVAHRRADGERLLLIAGRQVRTREGLEVLALATQEEFPDGLPFRDALTRVRWSGALTVIPWGFGKWSFYRGALVEAVVCRSERPGICLGDNSGRPELGGRPRLFREAAARGIPILPGSDPLPLPEQNGRAGSYGFLLEEGFDESRPAQSLRRTLRSLEKQPRTYGRCRELTGFCRDQLVLRLGRRREPAPSPDLAAAPPTWTR